MNWRAFLLVLALVGGAAGFLLWNLPAIYAMNQTGATVELITRVFFTATVCALLLYMAFTTIFSRKNWSTRDGDRDNGD